MLLQVDNFVAAISASGTCAGADCPKPTLTFKVTIAVS